MSSRNVGRILVACALGTSVVTLAVTSAQAQQAAGGPCLPPPACPAPPSCPLPAPYAAPSVTTAPAAPTPTPAVPAPPGQPPATEPSDSPLAFGATGGGENFAALNNDVTSAVGYVDSALPISQVRIRNDDAYDDNRPDRAEFFYAKNGPALPEKSVNYQTVSAYVEYAIVPRLSVFAEVPYEFLEPTKNAYAAGFSDVNLGYKFAWLYSTSQILTTQLRVYGPTGQYDVGLGTGHASLEPAILYFKRLSNRVSFEGELRKNWIPVGGSDFAGNVIRYGAGLSCRVYQNSWMRVYPVTEFVGWTVFNGKESVYPTDVAISAAGNTIVNAKFGVRTQLGKPVGNGLLSRADFYLGYGRALTGDVWYKDIIRAEFRIRY